MNVLCRYLVPLLLVPAAVLASPLLAHASGPHASAELGYGMLLFKMIFILAGVCLLAWASLRWGLKRFVAAGNTGRGMEVIARLAVEPRRSLLVVRVGSRHLLLSSSEAGMSTIAELDEADVALLSRDPGNTFEGILGKLGSVSRETTLAEAP